MRNLFPSLCRLIACFLVMTVLTYGIAMAAYACPQLAPAPVEEMVMEGMPCAEMDKKEPVLCAEEQSGVQLALEHLATTSALGPLTITSVIPAPSPVVPPVLAAAQGNVPLESGTDPPYLQTLRLRI
ncbi:hypothetical protein [Noviherbaspirillum soli]|uniref:hypothetical protein n=1 Tax=Noviherbaspirillum soli TaxID=1064518 RepID=UPI00188A63B5|nr:hypothetical protein [Noviherbaspirillum soli]